MDRILRTGEAQESARSRGRVADAVRRRTRTRWELERGRHDLLRAVQYVFDLEGLRQRRHAAGIHTRRSLTRRSEPSLAAGARRSKDGVVHGLDGSGLG